MAIDREALSLLASQPVARLATRDADGAPHVVPIAFAVAGTTLVTAVDAKPKSTRELKRLGNIEADPRVSVLADHYEADWSRLWWVRLDGRARLLGGGGEFEEALDLLTDKYPQYEADRPQGPVIAIAIERVVAWSASPESSPEP